MARALIEFTLHKAVVAPPASNITLDGDGVANATFITDGKSSDFLAVAAEVGHSRFRCCI